MNLMGFESSLLLNGCRLNPQTRIYEEGLFDDTHGFVDTQLTSGLKKMGEDWERGVWGTIPILKKRYLSKGTKCTQGIEKTGTWKPVSVTSQGDIIDVQQAKLNSEIRLLFTPSTHRQVKLDDTSEKNLDELLSETKELAKEVSEDQFSELLANLSTAQSSLLASRNQSEYSNRVATLSDKYKAITRALLFAVHPDKNGNNLLAKKHLEPLKNLQKDIRNYMKQLQSLNPDFN